MTLRAWVRVLLFGGVTAAALMFVLGVLLPYLVIDPPQGFGIHPGIEHNPKSDDYDGSYARIVAGFFAWLAGTYAGVRTFGPHGARERLLTGLSLAGVVAILIVADGLLFAAARASEAEPPPARVLPAVVSERTPLPVRRSLSGKWFRLKTN